MNLFLYKETHFFGFIQFSSLLAQLCYLVAHPVGLRHSAATLLLSMGISAKVVQEILGHSNFSTTMDRYSHVLPSMQQEAMNKMDDFFRQQP